MTSTPWARPHLVAVAVATALLLCAAAGSVVGSDRASRAARLASGGRVAAAEVTPLPRPVTAVTTPPVAQHAPARPPAGGKVLYLTFDDGPSPTWTPKVLAVLARYDARATFFEIGAEITSHPQTAALVRSSGHRVGNHTLHHAQLTDLHGARLRHEITAGAPSSCLRPPYGAVDAHVKRAAATLHQQIVLWDVDTRDWARPGKAAIVHSLLKDSRPGRIVLMHDGGGDRSQTVAALKVALPALARKGYRFESLPQC